VGLAPKAPFGDTMTRRLFRPHCFLMWCMVDRRYGGLLLDRITAKNPTLWDPRHQVGLHQRAADQ
jgi:hypothetical protein